jgi:hypothetical protein
MSACQPWLLERSLLLASSRFSRLFTLLHSSLLLQNHSSIKMLQAPESSPRSESHIPKVKELREALGFRDQSLLQSKIFNDRLRVFRREYQTGDGVAGTDLHQWKSTEQQAVLSLMVRDFLTANGSIFWPDRADDGHEFMESSRLQYSRDKPMCVAIIYCVAMIYCVAIIHCVDDSLRCDDLLRWDDLLQCVQY